jgi:hypothetical protein
VPLTVVSVRYRGYELRRSTPCDGGPQPLSWIRVYVSLPRTCHNIYLKLNGDYLEHVGQTTVRVEMT